MRNQSNENSNFSINKQKKMNEQTIRKKDKKVKEKNMVSKLKIKPTSFFISDKNIIVGYILSKILKYFKKRNEIIAKKICKNIFNKIKNYEYMNKHCNIKYCNIYQLENYKKNEIVIPLYAI